jgi:DNA-binding PadR family transcriptional regulator
MDGQHKRGLLRLFLLRTVSSEPKSGYDILKEITEKTQGEWHPSKGTIYPILSELDKEGLIETVEEGARARRAFRTTEKGMSHLTNAIKERRPSHRGRMDGRRLLFVAFHPPQGPVDEPQAESDQVAQRDPSLYG